MAPSPRTSDAVLDRLTRLHPKLIDLTLGRVERLLDRLGHPERDLPPVVHVAGTNGKGSVVAYLDACLTAAGYRVHVATSPHLVRFSERIRLAGTEIAEDALTVLLEECETVNGGEPITFFEIAMVATLLAFARTPADAVILETGLGGRLDASNVVDRPAATVITPIGLDHQQYLGETLAEIAGEKAGILKPGVPCVIATQAPEAAAVFVEKAARLKARLLWQGRDWRGYAADGGMIVESLGGVHHLPLPALRGAHQIGNAAQAIACLELLNEFTVPDRALADGMLTVRWPARLQRLTRGPLVEALPVDWELWLDGGHNPHAAAAVADFVDGWRDCPVHLISGMLNTKDAAGYFAPFVGKVSSVRTVAIPGEVNSLSAEALADAARRAGLEATAADGIEAALAAIRAMEKGLARVLICGSLYLAGTVLAENG